MPLKLFKIWFYKIIPNPSKSYWMGETSLFYYAVYVLGLPTFNGYKNYQLQIIIQNLKKNLIKKEKVMK